MLEPLPVVTLSEIPSRLEVLSIELSTGLESAPAMIG